MAGGGARSDLALVVALVLHEYELANCAVHRNGDGGDDVAVGKSSDDDGNGRVGRREFGLRFDKSGIQHDSRVGVVPAIFGAGIYGDPGSERT